MYTTIKTLQYIPRTKRNIVKNIYVNILLNNENISNREKEYLENLYLGREIGKKSEPTYLENEESVKENIKFKFKFD